MGAHAVITPFDCGIDQEHDPDPGILTEFLALQRSSASSKRLFCGIIGLGGGLCSSSARIYSAFQDYEPSGHCYWSNNAFSSPIMTDGCAEEEIGLCVFVDFSQSGYTNADDHITIKNNHSSSTVQ